MGRWSLRFADPALEARYQATRGPSDLRQLRLALGAGAVINAGFAPLDYIVLPENIGLALLLRIAVLSAVFLLVLGVSFIPYFAVRRGRLAAAAVVSFTAVFSVLIAVTRAPDVYLSGYVLVILFLLVFAPVGFVKASIVSWVSTALFAVLIPLVRPVGVGPLLTVYSQFIAANLMGMFALYWMEQFHRRDFLNLERIDEERGRFRTLLTRILPVGIVDRLEGGARDIADEHAETTVLFADIVGFTEMSSRCEPAAMVAFLNRIFGAFDDLAAQHGAEKIKTIGDAYMVAAGVPDAQPGHVGAIAGLALDMMAATSALRTPDGRPVRIRIGIHTGPLIAGVIGESRFLYDLWGDTVNIASRMESHGRPDCIQVSAAVRRRLGDRFRFEPLGRVDIKGKGAMATWRLVGRGTDESDPG